jgi:hypothetical protein
MGASATSTASVCAPRGPSTDTRDCNEVETGRRLATASFARYTSSRAFGASRGTACDRLASRSSTASWKRVPL